MPTPFYSLLFIPCAAAMACFLQAVGFLAQALRWLAKGGRRHGQGDARVLRTPDEFFEGLEGYSFAPHYFEHEGARLHYVDEGQRDASEVIVLLHGEPTWSYLYRHIIPPLVAEGHRVLALDFLGAGRSDKPVDAARHTFARHVASVSALLSHAGVARGVTLVIHDWGGLIGQASLPVLGAALKRLVVLNTAVGPTMLGPHGLVAFGVWQGLVRLCGRALPCSTVVRSGAGAPLSAAATRGYDAPFPDADHKALVCNWPLVYSDTLTTRSAFVTALEWARTELSVPVLVAFSTDDPLMSGPRAEAIFRAYKKVPCVQRVDIPHASHFLQEANPAAVAAAIAQFVR